MSPNPQDSRNTYLAKPLELIYVPGTNSYPFYRTKAKLKTFEITTKYLPNMVEILSAA
uniref:Uncharacterized protein n=1 Tax=Arundo donax TaxID=35708 RepID=A0A0A9EAP2_ARUDO